MEITTNKLHLPQLTDNQPLYIIIRPCLLKSIAYSNKMLQSIARRSMEERRMWVGVCTTPTGLLFTFHGWTISLPSLTSPTNQTAP